MPVVAYGPRSTAGGITSAPVADDIAESIRALLASMAEFTASSVAQGALTSW